MHCWPPRRSRQSSKAPNAQRKETRAMSSLKALLTAYYLLYAIHGGEKAKKGERSTNALMICIMFHSGRYYPGYYSVLHH